MLSIPKKLTTNELAAVLRVSPQTPIAALSRAGHYLGLRPCKLRNGRLLWDADEVSRLLNGEVL
ncbi:MAG: DNA-binding protein [Dechloromonas sp.]|nr:DNA-binding protein [Dechloromonas sp.]